VEEKVVTGPAIVAGTILDADVVTTNFVRNDHVHAAMDVVQYDVKFFNKNAIPEGRAIHITMPSSLTPLTSCTPSYGLEDISESS